ncbi:hypothetical protein AB0A71_42650 [Kitasatospora aureofaciens]|uniref:hypothetical protein n=1 Tax=Kitasatospora aureofaciens TaxID=1894 RepID=UPI00340F6164
MNGRGGRPEGYHHRQMLDAVRHLVAVGVRWASLAAHFPETWPRSPIRKGDEVLVGLGQVRMGVGMSRWQVGQWPAQVARIVCNSRTTW